MKCCVLKEVLAFIFSHLFDVLRFVIFMQFTEPEFFVLNELVESLIDDDIILLKFLLNKVHIAQLSRLTRDIEVAVREISIVVKILIFLVFL